MLSSTRAGGQAASDCARPASTPSTLARTDQSCVRDARAREATCPPSPARHVRDARARRSLRPLRLPIPPRQHEGADQNHRGAQELAHGEGSEDKPEVEVGFAKELHNYATEAVAGDEAPTDGAGRGRLTADQPQHDEQEPAFQSCFVELRRVPAFGPAAREDHAPRYITRTAVEFPVDKIPQAPQPQSDRNSNRSEIGNRVKREAAATAEQPDREDRPE